MSNPPDAASGAVQDASQAAGASQGNEDKQSGEQTVPDSRALVPAPEHAGDNDLIEKEWVTKAKQIVEHTAADPFRQQQELSKMKVDYMKKRYNKDIEQPA